ncbi:response regulator [Candidatus Bathyarchaeota archaeon]|nr:MAG: response regulator [Candidatus Bathyarchaeota archaeon]
MKRKARILIVDDDEDICKTLSLILQEEGYETDIANTGREAIKKSRENFYNVALLDIKLPDMEGTELLTKMRETSPKMIKIMVTGYPALKNAVEALNRGADAYLMKPVNPEKVIKTIKEKLKKQREEEVMTEEKIAMFVKTRTQKLLQESK